MKQKILLLGIVGLVVLGVVLALQNGGGTNSETETGEPPTDDPADVTLGFYNAWLDARNATDTDPAAAGLYESPLLQEGMKAKLEEAAAERPELDPVLCQAIIPEKIGAKPVYQEEYKAQTLIVARGEKLPGQATVSLVAEEGKWVISDIVCTFGEEAPDKGEFNFNEEGQLLKRVPPPLDPDYWYLVYGRDGVMGYTAKMMFDDSSVCILEDGSEQTCNDGLLTETATAFVQGDVSESGLTVKRLELK